MTVSVVDAVELISDLLGDLPQVWVVWAVTVSMVTVVIAWFAGIGGE